MSEKNIDKAKLEKVIAEARNNRDEREQGYRARALKMYPWICGRCMREFDRTNVHELTVHHRDHNHDNNQPDGSNWELLCVYCHDNEHQRQIEQVTSNNASTTEAASSKPFADLADLLKKNK